MKTLFKKFTLVTLTLGLLAAPSGSYAMVYVNPDPKYKNAVNRPYA